MKWVESSKAHLDAVGEDYAEHQCFAFGVGGRMIAGGIACILHGLIPALFPTRGSDTIRRLNMVIENRHAARLLMPDRLQPFMTLVALSLWSAALPWLLGAEVAIALPMSLLSLGFIVAYGLSAEQADPVELLVPVRLD